MSGIPDKMNLTLTAKDASGPGHVHFSLDTIGILMQLGQDKSPPNFAAQILGAAGGHLSAGQAAAIARLFRPDRIQSCDYETAIMAIHSIFVEGDGLVRVTQMGSDVEFTLYPNGWARSTRQSTYFAELADAMDDENANNPELLEIALERNSTPGLN